LYAIRNETSYVGAFGFTDFEKINEKLSVSVLLSQHGFDGVFG